MDSAPAVEEALLAVDSVEDVARQIKPKITVGSEETGSKYSLYGGEYTRSRWGRRRLAASTRCMITVGSEETGSKHPLYGSEYIQ